jgi:2',3'-cyclic-nucleotide 2'-phosphodiesterase (5'-nucleotidase family)
MRCRSRSSSARRSLIASGSHGKFLSRLDLDVSGGEVKGYKFKLIPIFLGRHHARQGTAEMVDKVRAPHEEKALEPYSGRPSRCSIAAATSTARSTI